MFHVLEEPQLTIGPLRKDLRLKRPVQLLDCRHLLAFVIDSGAETGTKTITLQRSQMQSKHYRQIVSSMMIRELARLKQRIR